MIDYCELPEDGEQWEQFSQEFCNSLGLTTESPPDRGADGGKDLLMVEQVSGPVHKSTFRWLVSCKHFARSKRSVSEKSDEPNILERVKAFRADGFLGIYSTLPSGGLNTRLKALVDEGSLKSYQIFDGRLIESELVSIGKSWILRRYFPESYKRIRPISLVAGESIVELCCDSCGKDLLSELYSSPLTGILAEVSERRAGKGELVIDAYVACKNGCDLKLQKVNYQLHKVGTTWTELSDIAMPNEFLRFIMSLLNRLRNGTEFRDAAFDKEKRVIMALSQRVFREVTSEEMKRFRTLLDFGAF